MPILRVKTHVNKCRDIVSFFSATGMVVRLCTFLWQGIDFYPSPAPCKACTMAVAVFGVQSIHVQVDVNLTGNGYGSTFFYILRSSTYRLISFTLNPIHGETNDKVWTLTLLDLFTSNILFEKKSVILQIWFDALGFCTKNTLTVRFYISLFKVINWIVKKINNKKINALFTQ